MGWLVVGMGLSMARRIARSTLRHGGVVALWTGRQFWGGVREGLVETAELHPGVRRLVVFGYALILFLFAVLLAVDAFRDVPWMPMLLSRDADSADPNSVFRTPILALVAAVVAYLVGWAYVLAGASDFGRWLFTPVLVVFGAPLWLIAQATAEATGQPRLLVVGPLSLVILVVAVLHLAMPRARFWRERPGVELLVWIALPTLLLSGCTLLLAANGLDDGRLDVVGLGVIRYLFLTCIRVMFAAVVVFSLCLAPEPVNLGVGLGRGVARLLRHWLSAGAFQRLALLAIFLPAVVMSVPLGLIAYADRGLAPHAVLLSVLYLAGPLALVGWAIRRRATGRWTTRAASLGLALAVATLVTFGLIVLAFASKQDLLGFMLAAPGLIPPTLLFVLLSTYSLMTFGARFANRDGQRAPRTGRALFFFGFIMLMMSGLLFATNVQRPDGHMSSTFQDLADLVLLVSMWFLALPYLPWIMLRRPSRLLGGVEVGPRRPRRRLERLLPGRLTYRDVALFIGLVALATGVYVLIYFVTPD